MADLFDRYIALRNDKQALESAANTELMGLRDQTVTALFNRVRPMAPLSRFDDDTLRRACNAFVTELLGVL